MFKCHVQFAILNSKNHFLCVLCIQMEKVSMAIPHFRYFFGIILQIQKHSIHSKLVYLIIFHVESVILIGFWLAKYFITKCRWMLIIIQCSKMNLYVWVNNWNQNVHFLYMISFVACGYVLLLFQVSLSKCRTATKRT